MFKLKRTRRNFLKTLLQSAGSLLAFGPFINLGRTQTTTLDPRIGVPNPFVTNNGRPILVCINGTNFQEMLNIGLDALGGLDLLIDNNQDALIKLNCVIAEGYPTTSRK